LIPWDDLVLVGVVARTHGNKGAVIVNVETDFPEERFRPGAMLFARVPGRAPEEVVLTSVRFQGGRPIVQVAGVDTIDAAERLAGAELRIPESEQRALPEGSYYHHQLVGCVVVTETGAVVGRVAAVEGEMGASRLVVRGSRAEVLIPLAAAICQVDIAEQRIVVTPPDGLLELNA
jgi:16S rRNA processing protein RimM